MNKRKRSEGFTLLEIILVLVVLSVIALSGLRMMDSYDNASRFQNTVSRMEVILDKLLGDERIVQAGRRVDFGYFGKRPAHLAVEGGEFPPADATDEGLDALSSVWISADPFIRSHDAWGRRLDYDGPAGAGGIITIESPGRNGAYNVADTGFDIDISMQVNIANYKANDVFIYCKDVRGTLLRQIVNGSGPTYDYHIKSVTFQDVSGTTWSYTSTAGGTLSYSANGFWSIAGAVDAGPCTITVFPADGNAGDNCNVNRNPELLAEGLVAMEVREVVYPKGGFANNNDNVFIVRFPGAVNEIP
ncbi:MAG: type II secretion system protein [Candidatus Omnitrophica bacterium]|nr:type II secretion system protein [Candidatus Omnitrophota bacterium]